MAFIPEQYLDQLRTAGLLASDPFASGHIAFPDGVVIGKPASVPGHSIPYEYPCEWGNDGTVLDAPTLMLHCDSTKWVVTSHDYVPGPGPGDFVDRWDSPEQAIAGILDFYFGSPARMDVKRKARED